MHSGEGVIEEASFVAKGSGHLAVIEGTMNSVYQSILESTVRPSMIPSTAADLQQKG